MGAVAQPISRFGARRSLAALLVALALALAAVAALVVASRTHHAAHRGAPAAAVTPAEPSFPAPRPHPRVVVAVPPGQQPPAASNVQPEAEPTPPAARGLSDKQIKQMLGRFRQVVAASPAIRGVPGTILPDGTAVVPADAPPVVAAIIAAGNQIATRPYIWGGGHGGWADTGYDCSGSVSFALAGAGLLSSPLTSGGFMSWGDAGPGRWVSIYANAGHVWMTVAGLRFDTVGLSRGTRWQLGLDNPSAYVVRHPHGL